MGAVTQGNKNINVLLYPKLIYCCKFNKKLLIMLETGCNIINNIPATLGVIGDE